MGTSGGMGPGQQALHPSLAASMPVPVPVGPMSVPFSYSFFLPPNMTLTMGAGSNPQAVVTSSSTRTAVGGVTVSTGSMGAPSAPSPSSTYKQLHQTVAAAVHASAQAVSASTGGLTLVTTAVPGGHKAPLHSPSTGTGTGTLTTHAADTAQAGYTSTGTEALGLSIRVPPATATTPTTSTIERHSLSSSVPGSDHPAGYSPGLTTLWRNDPPGTVVSTGTGSGLSTPFFTHDAFPPTATARASFSASGSIAGTAGGGGDRTRGNSVSDRLTAGYNSGYESSSGLPPAQRSSGYHGYASRSMTPAEGSIGSTSGAPTNASNGRTSRSGHWFQTREGTGERPSSRASQASATPSRSQVKTITLIVPASPGPGGARSPGSPSFTTLTPIVAIAPGKAKPLPLSAAGGGPGGKRPLSPEGPPGARPRTPASPVPVPLPPVPMTPTMLPSIPTITATGIGGSFFKHAPTAVPALAAGSRSTVAPTGVASSGSSTSSLSSAAPATPISLGSAASGAGASARGSSSEDGSMSSGSECYATGSTIIRRAADGSTASMAVPAPAVH